MKKLLALVLALVMTLGLATISSNAAYSDAADVSLTKAVDVMSAVGVFQGSDGKFAPKENLTREQAAKLIAYLDLGEKAAEALPAVKVFDDVEATRWSAKYIAYCQDAGYIAGVGENMFNPTGELTGYAFGKMVLCVLGYDADIEGFTGSAWSINVAKLMQSNDIADGIDGNASATLTREQAAQYCLNALKATMVEYDTKGTSIDINGAKITTGASKASDVTAKGNNKYVAISGEVYAAATEYTVELGEKLYNGDLKITSGKADDLNRPANQWQYKNEEIGTYGEAADYTFIVDEVYAATVATAATPAAKAAALSAQINDQLDITKASSQLAFSVGDNEYLNGGASAFNDLVLGDVVEVWVADNDAKDIEDVVITRFAAGKIDDVSTTLTKAQKEDGATCKIKVAGVWYTDDKIADFDATAFVKDAYILYVAKAGELIATAMPTVITGEVTALKGGKAQINGTYYHDATATLANGDNGTYYLGKAHQVLAFDGTASKSTDYAYIYNWTYDTKTNSDGVKVPTITLYYITVDGVKATAVAKTEKTTSGSVDTYYIDNGTTGQGMILGTLTTSGTTTTTWAKDTSAVARVVAFNLNSDGKFVQKAPKDNIVAAPANSTVNKTSPIVDNSKVATNDTEFVFVYASGNDTKVKTATGYKNVDVASVAMTTVFNSKNEALYTFVAANNGFKTDTNLAVVLDATPSVSTKDGDTFNTYVVAVDGAESKLTFKNATLTSPYAGMVFAYKMNGSNAEIDTAEGVGGYIAESAVTVKGTGYFGTAADAYLSTAEATIYTITLEFKNATDKAAYDATHTAIAPEAITVTEGATFDVADPIYYTVKNATDKTAGEVYVIEFVY